MTGSLRIFGDAHLLATTDRTTITDDTTVLMKRDDMSLPPTDEGRTATAANEIPVCPRHPDVAAYTRCQRCGRPACTRCQVPASVGFQCVDCVKRERAAHPVAATRSELGFPTAPGRPLVTIAVIVICCLVWVGESMSDSFANDVVFYGALGWHEPWRYLTNGFAHMTGSPFHLLFNMWALWVMGQYLEPLLGRVRFAVLYLLSILGGTVMAQVLTAPASPETLNESAWVAPLLGASGGVFGLFLAVVVLNRHLGREIGPMISLIALNVIFGVVSNLGGDSISWQAHLGGAITGATCAALLHALRRRPASVQYAALAGVGVLLAVIAVASYAMAGIGGVAIVG